MLLPDKNKNEKKPSYTDNLVSTDTPRMYRYDGVFAFFQLLECPAFQAGSE